MAKQNFQKIASSFIKKALQAVDPYRLIQEKVRLNGSRLQTEDLDIDLNRFDRIFILGAGKAAASMAAALENMLGSRINAGRIVVKYGHTRALQKTEQFQAGHPVPDQQGLDGSRAVLELAKQATDKDLILFVLSGGGSALFEALPNEISLADLVEFNQHLLASGATIHEMNLLRKTISLVKGGGFLNYARPATIVSFILSDVIGDPLPDIASGPTVLQDINTINIQQVLSRYPLQTTIPTAIEQKLLSGGVQNFADSRYYRQNVFNFIIGNNVRVLESLKTQATQAGFSACILSDRIQGEAREVANVLSAIMTSALVHGQPVPTPGCLIAGGEPTVTLDGNGKGGRNQELVLAALTALQNEHRPFYFCSLGTDGSDGPTDAAGAWIDQHSFEKSRNMNLDARAYLNKHDAYHFFERMGQLIKTGPTGTNVMDMIFCLF